MISARHVGSTGRPAPLAMMAGVIMLVCLGNVTSAQAQSTANFQSESSRAQRDRGPGTGLGYAGDPTLDNSNRSWRGCMNCWGRF